MAHFAKLDENNTVTQVVVVRNQDILVDDVESEQAGKDFLASIGLPGNWVQTSYNGNFRGPFAGTGSTYDPIKDEFIHPKEGE
jgi:hypothetical protein